MKTQELPRFAVEWLTPGWVVVDWSKGNAVGEPVQHREFADGEAARMNRQEES